MLLLSCGATDGGQDVAGREPAGDGTAETPGGPEHQTSGGAVGETNVAVEQPGDSGGGSTPAHQPDSETPPVASWSPHQLAEFDHCGDTDLVGLAAACADSEGAQTLVANGAKLALASVSLLELTGSGELNRASVEFTPTASQTFGIYLGTPNVPFSLSAHALQVMPRCARYLAPELSERLTGTDCSQLRGVYLVKLQAGVTYTLSFGPIAPQQWVRIYVQSS